MIIYDIMLLIKKKSTKTKNITFKDKLIFKKFDEKVLTLKIAGR